MILDSVQSFTLSATTDNSVRLKFKVQNPTGAFVSLRIKTVMGTVTFHVPNRTITVNFG